MNLRKRAKQADTAERETGRDPEATRGRILDAALDVFSQKGYHDTSVDEIVTASSTSKGAIYFHFPNKQALFFALVDKFANLLEKCAEEAIAREQIGIARVDIALRTILDVFGQYRPLAKLMLVQAVGLGTAFELKRMELHDRFAALIKRYLDEAIAVGDVQPVDTDVVAYAWMGAINEIIIRWVYTGEPGADRIMNTLRPMLLRSIGFTSDI
ncbi:MAG: TetR/AcrR family transcriptional regulator [Chloroflexota bacterium]|nr:TetR/AcrR family transcriptional regulator [Chloroflexota bacterium]